MNQHVELDGRSYTLREVRAAFKAARQLCSAYAHSDSDNGGANSIDWGSIDEAHAIARKALPADVHAQIREEARGNNEFTPPSPEVSG